MHLTLNSFCSLISVGVFALIAAVFLKLFVELYHKNLESKLDLSDTSIYLYCKAVYFQVNTQLLIFICTRIFLHVSALRFKTS